MQYFAVLFRLFRITHKITVQVAALNKCGKFAQPDDQVGSREGCMYQSYPYIANLMHSVMCKFHVYTASPLQTCSCDRPPFETKFLNSSSSFLPPVCLLSVLYSTNTMTRGLNSAQQPDPILLHKDRNQIILNSYLVCFLKNYRCIILFYIVQCGLINVEHCLTSRASTREIGVRMRVGRHNG